MGWFKLWAPSGAFDSRSYGKADCASAIVTSTADVEEVEVPGKSGSVIIPKNRWKNIDRTFSMFISLSNWNTIVSKLQECANGYYMLEDSWNTGYFYMARLRSCELTQSTPALAQGIIQIVFDCQPVRWLTTGAEWVEYSTSRDSYSVYGEVENRSRLLNEPTSIKLRPNFEIPSTFSDGALELLVKFIFYSPSEVDAVGSVTIVVHYQPTGNLIIDSLTHDLYSDNSHVLTPGGSYVPPTPLFNNVQTWSSTGTPPNIWPEIPPGWRMKIQAQNLGVDLTERDQIDFDVKTRACIL